ncbi:uncharacterized protein LOC134181622 isoform X2 [Corticium candelabrum]|uniref:uncharacterized protein LOC134181622 isoform X2 n=1 Tax=Corticium candelabrum TaxID=121492 RepID=UPI002E26ACA6|nr:uncharacterized protein LOC134181622 isoform X2 [Corticium candelabrum]
MSTEDSPRSGAELEARVVPDRQGDDTEDVAAGAACAAAQLLVQATFPSPGPLQVKGNLAENWREWSQLWRSYETVTRMTSQPDEYRLASFITCIGRAGLRIYNSLPFAEEAEKTDMARVIELMEAHCVGEANVTYERFVLDQRRQNHGEPFDKFLTSVREQAQRCRFDDQESDMIRDRIVCGVHDQGLRKQLLQRKNLSLADCVDLCRAYEATEKRAKTMSGADTEVHRVQKQYVPKSSKVKSKRYQSKDTVKTNARTLSFVQTASGALDVWLESLSQCVFVNGVAVVLKKLPPTGFVIQTPKVRITFLSRTTIIILVYKNKQPN